MSGSYQERICRKDVGTYPKSTGGRMTRLGNQEPGEHEMAEQVFSLFFPSQQSFMSFSGKCAVINNSMVIKDLNS